MSGQELHSCLQSQSWSLNDDLAIPNEAVGSFKSTRSVDCFKYILFTSRVFSRSSETFRIVLPTFPTEIQTKRSEISQLLNGNKCTVNCRVINSSLSVNIIMVFFITQRQQNQILQLNTDILSLL